MREGQAWRVTTSGVDGDVMDVMVGVGVQHLSWCNG